MSSTTSSQPQWVETLQATVAGIVEELFDLLSTGEAGLFHCMCFSSKRKPLQASYKAVTTLVGLVPSQK